MLTAEQQSIIENSIWVVNTALKRQGLQYDDDLRQSAILYMCRCIERFDPSKNIKWTTYAYRNVYMYIRTKHAKQVKKERGIVGDIYCLPLQFYDEQQQKKDYSTFMIEAIKQKCTARECKFLELKLMGLTGLEICQIMKCSVSTLSRMVQSIKTKARKIEGGRYV